MKFYRLLFQSTLLLGGLLMFSAASFAASTYDVVQTTATVGTPVDLEFEYTVDTAAQTWADADTLTLQLPGNFLDWGAQGFSAEYDSDTTNNSTGETAITAGAGNGQYAVSTNIITVKWNVTGWGAVSNGASTIRILITGAMPQYAGATSTFSFGGTTAAADTNPSGTDTVNVSAGDAAASIALGNNSRAGSAGTTTLTLTVPVSMAAQDTIVFTLPNHLNLASLTSATTDTFSGAGSFTCTASSQVVTCTASGAITAGTGTIVMSGIYATASASSQTLSSLAVNDNSASDADMATDSSGSITDVTGGTSSSTSVSLSVPEDFSVSYTDEGVRLEWTDPDDDAAAIEVLRGQNDTVSGTPYSVVDLDVEYYVDTDVEVGDEISYAVRSRDSSGDNKSDITEVITITVGEESDDTTDDSTDDTSDTTDDTSDDTSDDTTDDSTDDSADDDSTDDTSDDTTASEMFNDEIPEWAESAITVLATAGVVEGNPDGGFAAGESLNRAEAAAMLWRVLMMGDPTGADVAPFTDVELGEWYTDYVSSLKGLELVAGNPDGSYEPGESINRAEFLQMAMNVYMYMQTEELADEAMAEAYADLDTSAWYAQVVSNATAWGFVEGSACEEGTCFNAGSEINRAEASQILYNMFGATL